MLKFGPSLNSPFFHMSNKKRMMTFLREVCKKTDDFLDANNVAMMRAVLSLARGNIPHCNILSAVLRLPAGVLAVILNLRN